MPPVQAPPRYSAFADYERRLYAGPDARLAAEVAARALRDGAGTAVVFDDTTGALTDVDPRGAADEVVERLARLGGVEPARSGPGRPKLGVVSREVSLLPRHWDWLNAQPGGASATLRRLVEAASKQGAGAEQARRARDVAYKFMSVVGGDRPGFEDATRALYANQWDLAAAIPQEQGWPGDLAIHVAELVAAARAAAGE